MKENISSIEMRRIYINIIYYSDYDLEMWHKYIIKYPYIIIDDIKYLIKSATKNGVYVVKI